MPGVGGDGDVTAPDEPGWHVRSARQLVEGGLEALLLEQAWSQPVGNAADLLQTSDQLFLNRHDLRNGDLIDAGRCDAELERATDQVLLRAVVEVSLDAVPLGIRALDGTPLCITDPADLRARERGQPGILDGQPPSGRERLGDLPTTR